MPGRAAAEAMPKVSTPGSHMEESGLMTHVVYEVARPLLAGQGAEHPAR